VDEEKVRPKVEPLRKTVEVPEMPEDDLPF
jgi:hypothetical protein